jgi:3,4-dihydroxy 2-butanone 4-phosphate synthase/GTP cyclohydrolase II
MTRNGFRIISVPMREEDLKRLMVPMMSRVTKIGEISAAASTLTVVKSDV